MIYDALEMSYHTVRVQKDPECAVCGKNPTITELIDYEEFCGALSDRSRRGRGLHDQRQGPGRHAGRIQLRSPGLQWLLA